MSDDKIITFPKKLAEMAARLRESSESVGGWPIMEEAARALDAIAACVALHECKKRISSARNKALEEAANVAEQFRENNPFPTVYAAIARDIRALQQHTWEDGETKI